MTATVLQLAHASTHQNQALVHLVDAYAAELEARRVQLQADLDDYQRKLVDLSELDPLDFTGLTKLYSEHVRQIESLLLELQDSARD